MKEEKLQAKPKIQRIVGNYYEQINAKKFENLGNMDKFLETCNLPKLNREEAESLNRPMTSSEIEAVIKKLLAHKSPGPDRFIGEFYYTLREQVTLILLKLSPKIQEVGRLLNSFQEPSIILIPKPHKDTIKKESYRC